MTKQSMAGKIIIATPSIDNGIFKKSVIYVHTDEDIGSTGVMLNIPLDSAAAISFAKDIGWMYPDHINHGGPVDQHLGYVLHSTDYLQDSTIRLNADIGYTGSKHIITDINTETGPIDFMLATGYCSWKAGQLVDEVTSGMWLVADYDADHFFHRLGRDDGWTRSIYIAAEHAVDHLIADCN